MLRVLTLNWAAIFFDGVAAAGTGLEGSGELGMQNLMALCVLRWSCGVGVLNSALWSPDYGFKMLKGSLHFGSSRAYKHFPSLGRKQEAVQGAPFVLFRVQVHSARGI